MKSQKSEYFLAAAVYAWAVVVGKTDDARVDPLDPEVETKNPGLPKEAAPTAVDNMLPGHRFIRTLSASPIASGVTAHSIIPVKGAGPPAGQDDKVVKYESAHIDGVASEKIVRSTHSTQSTPATTLEVRRILYEHLGIPCGLECEVPDRRDEAVPIAPKPEPPDVAPEMPEEP